MAAKSKRWKDEKHFKTRGFGAISRMSTSSTPLQLLFNSSSTTSNSSILQTFFENHFSPLTICFFLVPRAKNPWGCRAKLDLKMAFFTFFWAGANFRNFRRAGVSHFGFESGALQKNGLPAAVRRFFVPFSGFFFRRRFHQYEEDLLKLPSFCFGIFHLCAHSSWDWVQGNPARVFLGTWPSALFISLFCLFFRNTVFPPEKKGVFC